jgi:archaeosine synthase
MERYVKPPHKRVLLLLPCSAKKPYHTSKTHKRFSFSIHASNFDTVVHEVIVTSPLGVVPRELDCFYPANSYDIPVTGEWKCQEKEFIREMVSHLLAQGYDKVISHLGEDTELIAGLHDDIVETVVGDSVSPASLTNLENALRDATAGMKVGDYAEDRKETIRSVLSFQFGKDIADRIMDENTFGTGRFPYWKIQRNKVQLAMMSEERGAFSLTVDGGKVVAESGRNIVNMMDFELKGNLFAVGVIDADPGIRIGDEAVVMKNGEVVAVGVAVMSGKEMTQLKRGIAVKIRHKAKK